MDFRGFVVILFDAFPSLYFLVMPSILKFIVTLNDNKLKSEIIKIREI